MIAGARSWSSTFLPSWRGTGTYGCNVSHAPPCTFETLQTALNQDLKFIRSDLNQPSNQFCHQDRSGSHVSISKACHAWDACDWNHRCLGVKSTWGGLSGFQFSTTLAGQPLSRFEYANASAYVTFKKVLLDRHDIVM